MSVRFESELEEGIPAMIDDADKNALSRKGRELKIKRKAGILAQKLSGKIYLSFG